MCAARGGWWHAIGSFTARSHAYRVIAIVASTRWSLFLHRIPMFGGSTGSRLRSVAALLHVWLAVAARRHEDVISSTRTASGRRLCRALEPNATMRLSQSRKLYSTIRQWLRFAGLQLLHRCGHQQLVAPFRCKRYTSSDLQQRWSALTSCPAEISIPPGLLYCYRLDDPAIEALLKNRELPSPPAGSNDRALFNREGYRMDVRGQGSDGDAMGAVIVGASPAGVFYGCQTFAQIVNNTAVSHPSTGPGATFNLDHVTITDWPSFHIRGMHVHELNPEMTDPGMMFFQQVDRMASHKMNFFSAMTTAGIPFNIPRYGEFELEMRLLFRPSYDLVPSINLGQPPDGRSHGRRHLGTECPLYRATERRHHADIYLVFAAYHRQFRGAPKSQLDGP